MTRRGVVLALAILWGCADAGGWVADDGGAAARPSP